MNDGIDLAGENQALRQRLDELEAVLSALRGGHVDALVMGEQGSQDLFVLKGAETRYRTFLEAMHEGAAMVDSAGCVLYANQALAGLLAMPLERVIGSNARDFAAAEHCDELCRLLQGGHAGACQGELDFIAWDGKVKRVLVSVVPLLGDGGQIALVATDLTERRMVASKIQALNATLEERVEDLQAVNRELDAFSFSVCHDLRAPLRAIDGFSRIIQHDYGNLLPADANQLFERINRNVLQLSRLIDDLLTLSRTGAQPIALTTLDLREIVDWCLEDARDEISRRGVEIRVGTLPRCDADHSLLAVVLQRLLSNALKFTSKRAKAVIEIGAEDRDGQTAIYVRDNGAGFDMKYAGTLFGVFQRLHSTDDFDGAGLGLAVVRRIVMRHGGRVWAEGKVSEGATFWFTLGVRCRMPLAGVNA